MNPYLFVWIIGFLFTAGFYRRDKRDSEMGAVTLWFIVLLFWPIALGDHVRKAMSGY